MSDKKVTVHVTPRPSDGYLELEVAPPTVTPKADKKNHPNQPDKWQKIKWQAKIRTGWAPRVRDVQMTIEVKPKNVLPYEGLDGNGSGVVVHTKSMKPDVKDGDTCEYSVIVKAEVDGSELTGMIDPDIVIDVELPATMAAEKTPCIEDDEKEILAGLLAREHLVGIRVVEDDSEDGFRVELADPKQESVTVKRLYGDTVTWCLIGENVRGYRFKCIRKPGHPWPLEKGRYNPLHGCQKAGRARADKDEIPPGKYCYGILVERMRHPRSKVVLDPDIVVDDNPARERPFPRA